MYILSFFLLSNKVEIQCVIPSLHGGAKKSFTPSGETIQVTCNHLQKKNNKIRTLAFQRKNTERIQSFSSLYI
jgi:hypothetical protein